MTRFLFRILPNDPMGRINVSEGVQMSLPTAVMQRKLGCQSMGVARPAQLVCVAVLTCTACANLVNDPPLSIVNETPSTFEVQMHPVYHNIEEANAKANSHCGAPAVFVSERRFLDRFRKYSCMDGADD